MDSSNLIQQKTGSPLSIYGQLYSNPYIYHEEELSEEELFLEMQRRGYEMDYQGIHRVVIERLSVEKRE